MGLTGGPDSRAIHTFADNSRRASAWAAAAALTKQTTEQIAALG